METLLKELIDENYTAKEIAEYLGINLSRVYRLLNFHNLTIKVGKISWPEEKLTKLAELLKDRTLSYREIGLIFGVSKQRIYQVIESYLPDLLTPDIICSKSSKYTRNEWKIHSLLRAGVGKYSRKQLTVEDFLPLPTHCPVLGLELVYFSPIRCDGSISLDRLDNSKPYTKENTVIMSWKANRIKSDGDSNDHELIAKFLRLKGL